MRNRLAAGLALVAALVGIAAYFDRVPFARAERSDLPAQRFDAYIHRPTGEAADPINLVFRGADAATVAAELRDVLDWQTLQGSSMLFEDRGVTHTTGFQIGLDLNAMDRYHLRIESMPNDSDSPYVLAAVHRDLGTPCGHVGTDFDNARDTVAQAFASLGYRVRSWRLNNTLPGRQCDGSLTAGDGTVAVIDLAGHQPPPQAMFPVGGAAAPVYLRMP